MKIVHIITRLILGGAQENTLLTVDGLHHTFGDDVTLITGPAEGPEGDLFERAKQRGLKGELRPEGVGRPEQYSTVYSGMDVDSFLNPARPREEVRRELGLADDEVAFGTVARLFERKGHDDILLAAPEVLRTNPKVRFVFIGDGIL